jgi:hypothetical protein
MRTTLTIDPDVAVQIERLRRERKLPLKTIVNEVMRKGLRETPRHSIRKKPFRTEPIRGVTPMLANLDNIQEVLSLAEGELRK